MAHNISFLIMKFYSQINIEQIATEVTSIFEVRHLRLITVDS